MNYLKHKGKVAVLSLRSVRILFRVYLNDKFQTSSWIVSRFSAPMPPLVKRMTLERRSNSKVWVETGTYLGQTTNFLLDHGHEVHTIEPDLALYSRALHRFAKKEMCSVYLGDSSEILPTVLKILDRAKPTAFWLDGHYSGTGTFSGSRPTPINQELRAIDECMAEFDFLEIFVDDVREFINQSFGYPSIEVLVNFARSHNYIWTIENDIFHMFPNK